MHRGDEIYFTVGGSPAVGKVLCHGRHGVTVEYDGKHHQVRHEHILGRKSLAMRHENVVDQGLDGAIVEDEAGKRRYVRGLTEAGTGEDEPATLDHLAKTVGSSAVLFDFGPVSACCTDHALEALHKALGDPPDDGIWEPHHDPFVRDHIEAVTLRGIAILDAIRTGIEAMVGLELRKAAGWSRWTEADLAAALAYLNGKDPKTYTLDDWLRVVDWIVQRYLPDGVIRTEAEYLAVRAQFAGCIQANMAAAGAGIEHAAWLVAAAPATRLMAGTVAKLTAREAAVLDFAIARAGEHITDIGDATRHRIRKLIVDHEEARVLGRPDATLWNLQSRLQDEFAVLNRDWRRVALTEVARDANEGFIAAHPVGTRLKRIEAYDACPFCRKIHGMVATVVDPAKPDKDGWAEVWVGKTNVGRSASPRKRVGDELVERSESERYWLAAGTMHPNCRGTWVKLPGPAPGADPKFLAWMEGELAKHKAEVLARGERAAAQARVSHG